GRANGSRVPSEVVYGRDEVVVEEGDDVEPGKAVVERRVALRRGAFRPAHDAHRKAGALRQLDMGGVRRGDDHLVWTAALTLKIGEHQAYLLAAAERGDGDYKFHSGPMGQTARTRRRARKSGDPTRDARP